MKLSVLIPAHNEEGSIEETVEGIVATLDPESFEFDVLVVNDASTDRTGEIMARLAGADARVRCIDSANPPGFGFAVRYGLDNYAGDAVAIVMADGSEDPRDLISYHRLLEEGFECAFGSRFMAGGGTRDYPRVKLIINRIVNFGIRVLFRNHFNDTTNAFKAYRREVIDSVQPLVSNHFNLTVELPLKATVRGFSYGVTPISWTNRRSGESKLSLQEQGSRYLYIVLMVFLEHHLSRGDYRRRSATANR